MERKFLEGLGLEKETIDKIMGENGKDIEKAKGDLSTKEKEVETLQEQLETANETIESYRDMDIESIKQSAEDYKTKFEAAEQKSKEDIVALKFEHSLESALTKAGTRNVKAAKALLDIEELKNSKNVDKDIEKAITDLQESESYLFVETEPNGTGGSLGNGGSFKSNSISKEKFEKMGYSERLQLKRSNEDLYKKLKEE